MEESKALVLVAAFEATLLPVSVPALLSLEHAQALLLREKK